MAYPAKKKTRYTYEDYLRTPEDKRYELIGGELIMVPAPTTRHQKVSAYLHHLLMMYNDDNHVGLMLAAPTDVYLDEENVVQPDILFISNEKQSIITEANIKGAPDLVIEIVSPSSGYYDLVTKKKIYAKFGVKEYWIVDPEERTVDVHRLEGDSYRVVKSLSEDDELTSDTFPGLSISLKHLFK